MKIFVSCAPTHVPRAVFDGYVSFIHRLVRAIREEGCEHVTYALVNSDPQLAEKPVDERARLCYVWDTELVRQADLVIAEASYPSTGLGIELQVAESVGIPIVLCFKRSAETQVLPAKYENPDRTRHTLQIGEGYVSLMALGLPTLFRVVGYSDDADAIVQILDAVRLITKKGD